MSLYDTIEVTGSEALKTFDRLYKEYPSTRRYPFLIGDARDLEKFEGMIEPPSDAGADYIAKASAFNVHDWLVSKDAKRPKSVAEDIAPQSGWVTLTNLSTGELKPTIYLGVLEVEKPAHVFAKLGFGDWNDCPAPHVHVALHNYWHEKFGTFPVAVSGDVVECFVPRPPSVNQDVLTLATEQHAYCYDIVEQGFGSKPKLAASLLGAKVWYFWWD